MPSVIVASVVMLNVVAPPTFFSFVLFFKRKSTKVGIYETSYDHLTINIMAITEKDSL
jgi:hypothetical protein